MKKQGLNQTADKREQVKKAGSTVFIVVAIASVIVMSSAMSIRFLWEKKSYNDRVGEAKTKARDGLQTNLANIDKLSEQFVDLEDSVTTNSKTILHALPPVYDYAALASSIDYLASISGVQSATNIGQDISATAVNSANTSSPVEIPLSLTVTGSYESIKLYVTNLEKSIRPIHVTSITYSGTDSDLQAVIQAVTHYQPARSLDVERSPIQ
jgi:Tfp pilus assembly protein PilO